MVHNSSRSAKSKCSRMVSAPLPFPRPMGAVYAVFASEPFALSALNESAERPERDRSIVKRIDKYEIVRHRRTIAHVCQRNLRAGFDHLEVAQLHADDHLFHEGVDLVETEFGPFVR